MNLNNLPEADRPDGEAFVSMAEACERWPVAYASCLTQLDGMAITRASTALFPRINGVPHLCLWADAPGYPGFEVAGLHPLPPDMAQIREMLDGVAQ